MRACSCRTTVQTQEAAHALGPRYMRQAFGEPNTQISAGRYLPRGLRFCQFYLRFLGIPPEIFESVYPA